MFQFLKAIFNTNQNRTTTQQMKKFLIVGLGNIGAEYTETRHNIGFKIVDKLAAQQGVTFETVKLGDLALCKIKGKSVFCLKPSTYMNLSGKALKYWMDKENISLENVLVVTDDIHLNFGILRIKTKGSDGGHNGLKDIQQTIQTTTYNRFRFGVGADFSSGRQVDYVLGKWNDEEKKMLEERLEIAAEAIGSFVLSGIKHTMNKYNGT